MKAVVRVRHETTVPTEADAVDHMTFGGLGIGSRFRVPRTASGRDRVLETSIGKSNLRADVTRSGEKDQGVSDAERSSRVPPDAALPEIEDRARLLIAVVLRKESRKLLESVLNSDDRVTQRQRLGEGLLSSNDALHSFARLVVDGGVAVTDGRLEITPLMERILGGLPEKP